jgi:hypothetical protein
MAISWDQYDEQTTGVESNTIPVNVGVNATAVSSLDFENRLQNLLTMLDGSEDAGVDFIKRVEASLRLLYGDYVANSMEILGLI